MPLTRDAHKRRGSLTRAVRGSAKAMTAAPPVIELRVERIASLFDPLDPFPSPSRDLSQTAEEFIVGWAREIRRAAPLRIVVHVPQAELSSSYAEILG